MNQPLPGPAPSERPTPLNQPTDCFPVPPTPPPLSWRRWVYWPAALVLLVALAGPVFLLGPDGDPYSLPALAGEHEGMVAVIGILLLVALAGLLVAAGLSRRTWAAAAAAGALSLIGVLLLLTKPTLRASESVYGWAGWTWLIVLTLVVVVAAGDVVSKRGGTR